jgi:hypothetical protein
MSLHADVSVPARDRRRLERLEERPDGSLALRLKTRWRDGTTHILMERRELIERLVPLIPPPRSHQVRHHGILAPSASQRDRVVPGEPADEVDGERPRPGGERSLPAGRGIDQRAFSFQQAGMRSHAERPEALGLTAARAPEPEDGPLRIRSGGSARRTRWAALLHRVFEVDALRCPPCASTMRLIAAIEDPAVAGRILECLKLPARAPPPEARPLIWRAQSPRRAAGPSIRRSPTKRGRPSQAQSRPRRAGRAPAIRETATRGTLATRQALRPAAPRAVPSLKSPRCGPTPGALT